MSDARFIHQQAPEGPSARTIKRDAQRAHAAEAERLGKRLLAIPVEDLEHLEIDAEVLSCALRMHKMKRDSAWRRLERYLYKLMRKLDEAELDEVAEAVAAHEAGRAQASAKFHEIERWRDRLVREGDPAVEALLELFEADRQQIRRLTLQARREEKAKKTPKAARALFKLLSEVIEG